MSDEALEGGCQCGDVRYRISGSPVMTVPGLIDITIGSLDDPAQVPPALHYWDSERLPWVEFADHQPRYAEFPPTEL